MCRLKVTQLIIDRRQQTRVKEDAGVESLAVTLFLQEKLKLVTVLGAGLLCGTALAVIIPEGVHALYEEILEGRHHVFKDYIENSCHYLVMKRV